MRIAFYAPMKPPGHPVPSGDRRVARLLIDALTLGGHEVIQACGFVSRDGRGDPLRQARLQRIGEGLAERLLRRHGRAPEARRPHLWFTYHLYYKAPDYIGPRVARGLGIPYVVAEASLAPKRAGGPWDLGHRAVLEALATAAGIVTLNPADSGCLDPTTPQLRLPPFLDPEPYRTARRKREATRAALVEAQGLDPARPWLLTVAMMRPGDKLASYRVLAGALSLLNHLDWQLVVVGDGEARAEVETALRTAVPEPGRIFLLGARQDDSLPDLYAAADLFPWPAIREAYGMALLEAQAAGLPVVAGREGGVPAVVRDGESGLLTKVGDARAFAAAIAGLLEEPARRLEMSEAAARRVQREQSLDIAAKHLNAFLERGLVR